MAIETRGASPWEYPVIRDIFARAFKEDEAELWDYLVAHDRVLQPEMVRVAEADGRPVACTVVLPRRIRTRAGWVDGAVITLVACHPDFQGQGFGGAAVRDAVRFMGEKGLALGILYGHPTYYPRFGFAPVLPAYRTVLRVDADAGAGAADAGAAQFHEVEEGDCPALAALYDRHLAGYLCAVARPAELWQWRPRGVMEGRAVLVSQDRSSYAFVNAPDGETWLQVMEGAVVDGEAGERLLDALLVGARRRGRSEIRLGLPPDHPLVGLALRRGAAHSQAPAAAGMAVVTHWEAVLLPGYAVAPEGLALLQDGPGGRPVLWAGRVALTQLALGYKSLDDLLASGEAAAADEEALVGLRRDFPPGLPKWSLAPFWF